MNSILYFEFAYFRRCEKMEVYLWISFGLFAVWWFFLRPRGGGKDAPPLVTESSVVPLPFIGVVSEFLKSPNDMMRRCYNDYGKVFTIPVRFLFLSNYEIFAPFSISCFCRSFTSE